MKNKPVIEVEQLDQSIKLEGDKNELLNKINNFQRQNTRQIKEQDLNEDKDMRRLANTYLNKVEYLQNNFEEEWIRENYL